MGSQKSPQPDTLGFISSRHLIRPGPPEASEHPSGESYIMSSVSPHEARTQVHSHPCNYDANYVPGPAHAASGNEQWWAVALCEELPFPLDQSG